MSDETQVRQYYKAREFECIVCDRPLESGEDCPDCHRVADEATR